MEPARNAVPTAVAPPVRAGGGDDAALDAAVAAYLTGDVQAAQALVATLGAPPAPTPAPPAAKRTMLGAAIALRAGDPAGALASLDAALQEPSPPATAVGRLELRILGGFDVAIDGVPVTKWPRRKAKLALAALVLNPAGLAPADFGDVLGDELTPTIARVAVLNLRRSLEPALAQGEDSRYVRSVEGRYALDASLLAPTDLQRFEALIARAQADPAGGMALLAQAIQLYRGHLLDDAFYGCFFEEERERARQQAVSALLKLASQAALPDEVAEGYLRRATTLAPDLEDVHVALIRFYHARGRDMMARKAYWDGRRGMKIHLGFATGPALEAAFQALGQLA